MIRIRSIDLSNVKNVAHGSIAFRDNVFGSTVTGIYGQNGSGKTAVVDALACVQGLMRGRPLPPGSADLVGAFSAQARVDVEFEVTESSSGSLGFTEDIGRVVADGKPFFVGYTFAFQSSGGDTRLVSESVSVRADGLPRRDLISYSLGESGKDRTIRPETRWRALQHLAGSEASLELAVAQRSDDLRASSKVFSLALENFAVAARSAYCARRADGSLPRSAADAYEMTLIPLMDSLTLLKCFAVDKLEVFGTTRGAALAFNAFSLSAPVRGHGLWAKVVDGEGPDERYLLDVTIPADRTTVIPIDVYESLRSTTDVVNQVLGSIVPGLGIEVNLLNKETMEDGTPGVRVEVLSHRGEVRVPFRSESEGVKKIVSLLGRLIDVYADDSACLVIDEVDSGIFEFLLGELLQVITERGKGQLVFTAHNLRPLECLPAGCLVFTTVNPDNRYIKFRGSAASNNLRNQYLRAINLGGQKERIYDPTSSSGMDAAFFRACHPEDSDFDALLAGIAAEHE